MVRVESKGELAVRGLVGPWQNSRLSAAARETRAMAKLLGRGGFVLGAKRTGAVPLAKDRRRMAEATE